MRRGQTLTASRGEDRNIVCVRRADLVRAGCTVKAPCDGRRVSVNPTGERSGVAQCCAGAHRRGGSHHFGVATRGWHLAVGKQLRTRTGHDTRSQHTVGGSEHRQPSVNKTPPTARAAPHAACCCLSFEWERGKCGTAAPRGAWRALKYTRLRVLRNHVETWYSDRPASCASSLISGACAGSEHERTEISI